MHPIIGFWFKANAIHTQKSSLPSINDLVPSSGSIIQCKLLPIAFFGYSLSSLTIGILGKFLRSKLLIYLSDSSSAIVTGVSSSLIFIAEFLFCIITLAAWRDISAIIFFISSRLWLDKVDIIISFISYIFIL